MDEDGSLAMSERRQALRVHVALRVKLDDAIGQTQNISASGVYITFPHAAAQHVHAGSSIRLEILFEHANPDGPLKVVCGGDVVRVEHRDDHVGVAARITSYRFGDAGTWETKSSSTDPADASRDGSLDRSDHAPGADASFSGPRPVKPSESKDKA